MSVTDADHATGLRITQTVPGGLMADAIAQALADERDAGPERALLRRILRKSGAQVFTEPGGQPAWLGGGSIGVPVSREETALIEDVLR